jgi:hypothetical protein
MRSQEPFVCAICICKCVRVFVLECVRESVLMCVICTCLFVLVWLCVNVVACVCAVYGECDCVWSSMCTGPCGWLYVMWQMPAPDPHLLDNCLDWHIPDHFLHKENHNNSWLSHYMHAHPQWQSYSILTPKHSAAWQAGQMDQQTHQPLERHTCYAIAYAHSGKQTRKIVRYGLGGRKGKK